MIFSHSISVLLRLVFLAMCLRHGQSMPMRASMPFTEADSDDTTTPIHHTEPSPPEFMKVLYECWSLQNATDYKACLEAMGEGDRAGLIMDANEVVGLLGNFYHQKDNEQDNEASNTASDPLKSSSVSFNISSLISSNNVIKFVELRLFRSRMSQALITKKLSCGVVDTKATVVNVSLQAETSSGEVHVIETQSISIDELLQDQWLVFSQLGQLVQDWMLLSTAYNNYRNISVIIEGLCSEPLNSADIGLHRVPEEFPLLAVFMETSTSKETKPVIDSTWITPAAASDMMGVRKKKQIIQNSSCRLVNFTVNFTDLGWNFIIGPSAYQANFCSGTCNYPLSSAQNGTLHSQIQAYYNIKNPSQVPSVCCSPTKTTSLAVLVATNSRTVEIKYFPDMAVTECGCR